MNEAVAYEQDILNSKVSLIKAGQKLKSYKALRKAEFEKRSEIKHLARNLDVAIKIIHDNLPKVESLCKKRKASKAKKPKEKFVASELELEAKIIPAEEEIKAKPSSLELELLEIKKKLEKLQG